MRFAKIVCCFFLMLGSTALGKQAAVGPQTKDIKNKPHNTLESKSSSIAPRSQQAIGVHNSPQARMVPHFENGIRKGFRVLDIAKGSILDNIGLENEDVVLSVNGRQAKGVETLILLMFEELKENKLKNIRILRRGKESTIKI